MSDGSVQGIVEGNVRIPFASFQRALQLNPGSEQVQRLYANYATALGRHDEAIAAAQRAVTLDPISPAAHLVLANSLFAAGRYVESEAAARRALALQPGRPSAPAALGWALMMQGRHEEALAAFAADPIGWNRRNGRTVVLARMGRVAEARRELELFQHEFGDNAAVQYAEAEAQLGNLDSAMRWLETARRVRDPGLTGVAFVDPMLEPLHDDPRFRRLLADLGFDVAPT